MKAGTVDYLDEGSGPAVVLLHAFPLSRLMWREQLRHLAGRARVLAPDLGGFGASGAFDPGNDGPVTMEKLADDVAAMMDAAQVGHALVAGVSMGGYVALALAARHRGRIGALLLADTRAEADSAENAAGREAAARKALAEGSAAHAEGLSGRLLGTTSLRERPALVAEVRGWISAAPAAAFAAGQRGMALRADRRDELAAIAVPTAVLVGAEDVLTPPEAARVLATGIAGATLHVLEGAGHLSQLETPGEWNAALDGLLERYSALTP